MRPIRVESKSNKQWYLYVVHCADGSLYTGVTTDLSRRVKEHNDDNKRGAKYTRSRRPVKLVFWEHHSSRSAAQSAEYSFKKLSKKKKNDIISSKLLERMGQGACFEGID